MEKIENGTFVLVTTGRRGVFAGTLVDREGDNIILADARNCIYWSTETRGAFGLASRGPQPGSKIGPAVKRLELDQVSSVSEVTPEARALWEAEPWG